MMNLEEHIRTTLLPVKARLEAQLYGDALGLEKDEPICWPEKEENVTSVSSAGMDLDEGAQDAAERVLQDVRYLNHTSIPLTFLQIAFCQLFQLISLFLIKSA